MPVGNNEHQRIDDVSTDLIPYGFPFYSVLVSVSFPKALYQLESDNIFRITLVVPDWLG